MLRKIVKFFIPSRLFRAIEPTGHLIEAYLWQALYGFPMRKLKVIGVTGTDGKTTTTTLIWKMLAESGYKVGFMTSIGYGTNVSQHTNYTHMTTMPTRGLLQRVRQLKKDGIEWLVLETSSHALAQNRVALIPYQIAVMTNVTGDHLDYHGTFENYKAAKQKLFQLVGQNTKGLQVGVVNADDPSAADFAGEVPHPIRYGVQHGDLQATDIRTASAGSQYLVRRGDKTLHVITHLPGSFNVYNSLATVCVGLALGLTNRQIEAGIASLTNVEGRMDVVDEGQDFTVIADIASTPGAFEAVLPSVKKTTRGRLIVVFGSAGRRDEAKRSTQGAIAGKYADIVVATEEDDRDEDGAAILDQIAEGAKQAGKVLDKDLFLVHDRTEAIRFATGLAKPGDTVALLGKGHEKIITRADGDHPWDEVAEARKALQSLKFK